MGKDYPTADLRRCYDCGVLSGRDHHFDCTSRGRGRCGGNGCVKNIS